MTIVCALHFSDPSLAAVTVAAQRAHLGGEPLWLVDLVPPKVVGTGERQSVAAAGKVMRHETAALAGAGVTVHTEALVGPFARAVRQFCAAKRAGLLVVGDSARTLGPLIAGPLDRFADRINLPVLVVRDAAPFEAWATGRPLKVMLAFDRTWRAAAARDWIAGLAAFGAIDLVASYLRSPRDDDEPRAGPPEAALAVMPSNVHLQLRLEPGHPHVASQLLQLASAEHADVVVVGTRPHRGPVGQQWSLSHELLALAPMSVACVPEPRAAPSSQPWQRDEGRLVERTG